MPIFLDIGSCVRLKDYDVLDIAVLPSFGIQDVRGPSGSHTKPQWASFLILTRARRAWGRPATPSSPWRGPWTSARFLYRPALDPALGDVELSWPDVLAGVESEIGTQSLLFKRRYGCGGHSLGVASLPVIRGSILSVVNPILIFLSAPHKVSHRSGFPK